MVWSIVPQKVKKSLALVKKVEFALSENKKTGASRFIRLKQGIFQVLAKNDSGSIFRIKKILNNGSVKYVVQQPNYEDYPMIKIGEGKKSRIIPDVLSPKKTYMGQKNEYENETEFKNELTRFMGEVGNDVLSLLTLACGVS